MVSRFLMMSQRHDKQPLSANFVEPTSPVMETTSPDSTRDLSKTAYHCGHKSGSSDEQKAPNLDPKKSDHQSAASKSLRGHTCQHGRVSNIQRPNIADAYDSPNEYLWLRLESLVERMFSENQGITIRNVKSLMSTIPSVFSGSDIILWLVNNVGADDIAEAVHLASRISSMGYLFSIVDHTMTVKNDSHTYYRFQTPCLYPSRCQEAETVDYAVFLCKRTMQNKHRLELADFEAERLASLQSLYRHKWEFIYMQAEAEMRVDKKRDKFERLVLESQEAAYWDVHRPAPGCVNTTEVDMRKVCRAKRPKKVPLRPNCFPIPSGSGGSLLFSVLDCLPLSEQLAKLAASFHKHSKVSKSIESLQNYCDQYAEFDLMLYTVASGTGVMSNSATLGGGVGGGTAISSSALGLSAVSGAAVPLLMRKTSGAPTSSHITPATLSVSSALHSTPSPDRGNETANLQDSQTNPWISDNTDYWNSTLNFQDLSIRRVKRWSFSFQELLKDPLGRGKFQRWLEKEFSAENLRFWQECQDLKTAPLRELPRRIQFIYSQYLSLGALEPVNVDSTVREIVFRRLGLDDTNESERGASVGAGASHLDRYCFEEAEEQIFLLMKSDSYCRFLRSDVYREFFANTKKKSKKHRGGVSLVGNVVNFGTTTALNDND